MGLIPRVVVVVRKSALQGLLERHGTRPAAAFYLQQRGQDLTQIEAWHERFQTALHTVLGAIPRAWRRTRIDRSDLDRFLFEPEDIVMAVGQDGLVANVAKYLQGQPVIGVSPDPTRQPGILARHAAESAVHAMKVLGEGSDVPMQERVMVQAELDNGLVLRALNEVFIGHRSHQSARYCIQDAEREEHQSSSGVLVTTGTGATGWSSSVLRNRRCDLSLPDPEEDRLAFFVREAWSSPATGCEISEGSIQQLSVVSEMPEGGVVFGDGMEQDALPFGWGQRLQVRTSPHRLRLVA